MKKECASKGTATKPDAPEDGRCSKQGISSLNVHWNDGASNGGAEYTAYTVTYEKKGNTDPS